jgi:metal-responsive CopG/Arc/MetJ family transcriptional regulator
MEMKMRIAVQLDCEEKKVLDELKKARYTRNSSQVIREALRSYHASFFKPVKHTGITQSTQA